MRLKELRANKTQTEISQILNIPQTTYSNYENNKAEPNIEMLCKIADYYNVSLDYLCEHKTKYQQDIGYLNEEQLQLVEIIKSLNETNLIRVISYASGLLVGQEA